MRVLLTTQPGEGHWRPLASLAKALRSAGHDVAFATSPIFCSILQRHGFHAFSIGVDDWLAEPTQPDAADSRSEPVQAAVVLLDEFIPRAVHNLPELLALCRDWRPNLIVREQSEFTGYLAAEILELPHATLQVSAYRPLLERRAAPALNRLRRDSGLPPDPKLVTLYRYLFLLTFPPSFFDPLLPLPPAAFPIRLASFDLESALPASIGPSFTPPLVYATLGTAYNRTPGLLDAIVRGLRSEPFTLVLTAANFDASHFGTQPDNIIIERYIPQSLLLPHCDLVVCHGGSGTVRAALSHGLPMVIIPIAADQPDHARRCAELGLAVVVDADRRTPEAIRDAVRAVRNDPAYRQRAQQMRAEFELLPDVADAVTVLERLVDSPSR